MTCACGHEDDEHGFAPNHPGSTSCNDADCYCLAYKKGPDQMEED